MVYKRGDVWWMDRTVDSKRFREPLGTGDHKEARELEDARVMAIRNAGAVTASAVAAIGTFNRAVAAYLKMQEGTVAEGTIETERQLAKPLIAFFGDVKVRAIAPELVKDYRDERLNSVSAGSINQEVALLKRVLRRLKIEVDIKPLKHDADTGRSLTAEEKATLFGLAGSNPAWRRAFLAARLAASTGMRRSELQSILWRDVSDVSITVRKSKTAAGRGRVIPLNQYSRAVLRDLVNEFPARADYPVVPFKSWRSAWESLREAANLPGLHFHHLRHCVATELAEGDASDQTILSIMGHMSAEMISHYSHIRMAAKTKAMEDVGA